MTTEAAKETQYVLCVNNEGYPVSLERMKLYQALPDDRSERGLLRVIDESGEDYLYPASRFIPLTLSKGRATLTDSQWDLLQAANKRSEVSRHSTLKRDIEIIQRLARDLKKAEDVERYRHIGEELAKTADDIERVIKDEAS